MSLVQISERRGVVKRLKPGVRPVVDLHLEPHQQIVKFDINCTTLFTRNRTTDDYAWTAWVATTL